LLAIKQVVDKDRRPGRFLLTGSANPLLLPQVADSLAGRMEILTLYGFTQGELMGQKDGLLDKVFSEDPLVASSASRIDDLSERLCIGGFPEVALSRRRDQRRAAWFESYIDSFVHRDIRDLANISGALEIPNMLKLLATRACQPLNLTDLARQLTIQPTTFRRYLALLEVTYFLSELPAWTVNLGKRVTKAPKLLVHDSGMLCHLLGLTPAKIVYESVVFGQVLENFVANELLRQLGWSETRARLYHFRAHSGEEVDLVLEAADGRVVGIEVKTSQSLGASDWKGLKFMRDALGDRFHRGIVLYNGPQSLPLGKNLQALPLAALWQP